ncbi:MAG TPA: zinc metalloprotease HtpX [Candidatus Binatia bacterium]|nr:zinc metalloprotease HtpX [Candidatus Binatia bacterium]
MWNQVKTVLLLGLLAGIALAIGYVFGGTTGLTIAFVLALGINVLAYFFSDKIVLMMYRAREATRHDYPALHRIVDELARSAGIPKPQVYIIPTETPNAFATGRNPKHAVVAATEGILNLLSEEELRGVLAHELGHVKNRDILITTIAATIATVISYAASMARYATLFGGNRENRGAGNILALLFLTILTPIAAMLIQLAISRTREYQADATGAHLSKKPEALARALEKISSAVRARPMRFGSPATSSLFIVNPFTRDFFVSLLSTHPPTEERVRRLKEMKV